MLLDGLFSTVTVALVRSATSVSEELTNPVLLVLPEPTTETDGVMLDDCSAEDVLLHGDMNWEGESLLLLAVETHVGSVLIGGQLSVTEDLPADGCSSGCFGSRSFRDRSTASMSI